MMQMLLLLLLLSRVGLALGQSNITDGTVAHVRTKKDLYEALTGKAETIVLHNDVALGPEFQQFEGGAPLYIDRNVTIIGAAGKISDVNAMPMIDLRHLPGIIQICSTCSFVFEWVNIAHENQVGTGLGMSVFRGDPGSRLERIGGVGLRTACPPTTPTLFALNKSIRSPLFPSPPGGRQLAGRTNFTFRGKSYQDMLLIGDLSGHIAVQQITNTAFMGGYSVRRRNATRLCDHIVSAQCLQRKLPEECIAELMANNSSSLQQNGGGVASTSTQTVAIAVPVAVAGVLGLAAAAALLIWRQRKQRQRTTPTSPVDKAGTGSNGLAAKLDVEAAGDQGPPPDWSAWSSPGSKQQRDSNSSGFGPWQLLWSSSAPNTAWEGRDDIELGVLLGAGSFARVYKGRWAGLDVAVKVIQHDTGSAKDVANEVQLMLNLCHPNIVRAYHCITKQLATQQPGSALPAQPLGSKAPAPGANPGSREGQNPDSRERLNPGSCEEGMVSSFPDEQQQLGSAGQGSRPSSPLPASTLSSSKHVQDLTSASSIAALRHARQGNATSAGSAAGVGGSKGLLAVDAANAASGVSQQGFPQGMVLLGGASSAGPGSQPSTTSSFSAGRGSADNSSIQAWQLLPASGSARFAQLAPASDAAGLSRDDSGTYGSADSSRGTRLVDEKPAVMCETWLVTELCDRGTLARQASEWQPECSEQDMLRLLHLLRDVACGLKLLKAQHVVHADLNAHNVLVAGSSVAPHGLVAKVADLGLSRVLKQHATHRTTRTVGMLTHQPPELLRDGRMSPAVDVYSFGIMMYEVYTRQVAYPRMRYGQIYHQVVVEGVRPTVPPEMPEDYELLMKRCWSAEPGDRPTVDMLLDCLDLMIEDRQGQQQDQQQC